METDGFAGLKDLARRKSIQPESEGIPRPRFRWKTRVLVPGLIIAGFLVLQAFAAYREFMPAVRVQAAPVVLKRAQDHSAGAVTVQAAGWVEAEPYKSYVTALTDGVVSEVLVLEGDPVKAGQVVVRLVEEDARLALQSAQAKVKELEAQLAVARAELIAAQSEWENPVERERAVEVSEALLAQSRATLERIAAEIEAEEANLEHLKSDYEKGRGLYDSKSLSELEMIRRRAQYRAAQASIKALHKRRTATKALIGKHEAELKAAGEHMRLRTQERLNVERARATVARMKASLDQARTALDEARLRLERMQVKAPVDGIVMARLTEPGSKVVLLSDNPGSARVLSLYQPKRLQVRVDVPLADAAKIGVGQKAEIAVEVSPERTFSGTVTRVLHEANVRKNTLEVKVSIADPDPQLRPEMLAKVRFLADSTSNEREIAYRVFAPDGAIKSAGGGSTVWTVTGFDGTNGLARQKAVKVGTLKTEGLVQVHEGLQPGDLIITRSQSELTDGKRVHVIGE